MKHLLALTALLLMGSVSTAADSTWAYHSSPIDAGFSSSGMANLVGYVRSIDTDALVVVVDGKILWEYGRTSRINRLASARKSVVAMIYGNYVNSGTIDLSLTLEQLGIDDIGGLLPIERRATIQHILQARSGVYHDRANPGDFTAFAPPRGSVEPGTYWLYNNWDFNVTGTIFEQVTGRNLYDVFNDEFAIPLEFEDWDRTKQEAAGDSSQSMHLSHQLYLSTRDMARLGELMHNKGAWGTRQVIPESWVETMVSPVTRHEELNPEEAQFAYSQLGYGYMWWVFDGPNNTCAFEGAYTAQGARGQYITVLPKLHLVVAHSTFHPRLLGSAWGPRVVWDEYMELLNKLIAAKQPPACR